VNIKPATDSNGNSVVKVTFPGEAYRGFSVQTNGNMPKTHRSIAWEGDFNPHIASNELFAHVKQFGTDREKEVLGW